MLDQLDEESKKPELQNQTLRGKHLRLMHALKHLKLQGAKDYDLFNSWLKEELDNQKDISDNKEELMVSLNHDLKSLALYQSGPADDYIEKTLKFIAEIGDDKEEFDFLQEIGQSLGPPQVGYWLQLKIDHVEAGWYFPGEFSLEEALQSVAPSKDKEKLVQWAQIDESAECLQLRRSIGKPLPMAELLIVFEAEDIDQYFAIAKEFFDVLDFTWFGTALEDQLKDLKVVEIGLVIGLNEEGACKLGIFIFPDSDELVLTLGNLSKDFSYENLARFEGLLLAEGPDFITFSQEEEGQNVDFYYLF